MVYCLCLFTFQCASTLRISAQKKVWTRQNQAVVCLLQVKGEANVPSPTEPQTIISNGRNLLADVCTRTLQWRRSRAHLET